MQNNNKKNLLFNSKLWQTGQLYGQIMILDKHINFIIFCQTTVLAIRIYTLIKYVDFVKLYVGF